MSAKPARARFLSHAKINLVLQVLGLRSDGFHELHTHFQSIELHDDLSFSPGGEGFSLSITGADLPADDANLVLRGAELFAQRLGRKPAFSIHLHKRIPLAAGLGGGSSNAATTLMALNLLSGEPLDMEALHDIACALGSDVPYFLRGGHQLGTGRGEILTPLADPGERHLLILVPPYGVKASQAYRDLDLTLQQENEESKLGICQLCSDGAENARWNNDLERGVFVRHPDLGAYKQRLIDYGADEAVMCGSGSTIVGAFSRLERAERAHKRLISGEFDIILTKTISAAQFRRGFSPVFDEA